MSLQDRLDIEQQADAYRSAFADGFFRSQEDETVKGAAAALGQAFDCSMALISRIKCEDRPVEAYGVYDAQRQIQNLSYRLAHTPCEHVYRSKDVLALADGVCEAFPKASTLAKLGFRGYVGAPIVTDQGQALGVCCLYWLTPLSEAKLRPIAAALESIAAQMAHHLTQAEKVAAMELAASGGAEGLWFLDLDEHLLTLSPRAKEITGVDATRIRADRERIFPWLPTAEALRAQEQFLTRARQEHAFSFVAQGVRPTGEAAWYRIGCATQFDNNGEPRACAGGVSDVTALINAQATSARLVSELEEARATAERKALTDVLTNLPNRRHLDSQISFIEEQEAACCRISAVHIDLDGFKSINDIHGHDAGDYVLIHVASILRSIFRKDDFVARTGGDEFVALMMDASAEDVERIGAKIIEELAKPITYKDRLCHLGASIGVASAINQEAPKLLQRADQALYLSKRNGRGAISYFTPNLERAAEERATIGYELRQALDRGELLTFYQPQIDAQTQALYGVEALIRWRHPTRGILAPGAFLHVAEELKLMSKIDEIALDCAVADMLALVDDGIEIPRLSVNASADRIYSSDLVSKFREANKNSFQLVVELHETIFYDRKEEPFFMALDALRDCGVEIEIDDFGSGHASITGLMRTTPDGMKVDRQFIQPMLDKPSQHQLVSAIIEMGKALNIKIIAEGVETKTHAAALRPLGCDVLQGFAYAKPIPLDALRQFIQAKEWLSVA